MAIKDLAISYPDFKLNEIIDPEHFDINNNDIVIKVNDILSVLNQITDATTDGSSGADTISLTAISPFISTKLQAFLEEVITQLQSTTDADSGADFIASTTIAGVTGNTVQAQLESIKAIFDDLETRVTNDENALTTHKSSADHDGRYYTKTQLDGGQLDTRYYTETELTNGALDGRYYTEPEENPKNTDGTTDFSATGVLDNRYYTEKEEDATHNDLYDRINAVNNGTMQGVYTDSVFPDTPANGTLVKLTADYTLNGFTYKKGNIYQYDVDKATWIYWGGQSQNITPATLSRMINVLDTSQVTSMVLKAMKGKTIVNHMGWQGGFHEQGRWANNLTIDTATYKLGGSSGKIDNSAGTTEKVAYNFQKMYLTGKYVLVGVWAKAVSGTPTIQFHNLAYDSTDTMITSENSNYAKVIDNTWKFYWYKFDHTSKTANHFKARLDVDSYGTADDVVNFDGMVVYELTSSEYSYAHTQAEIEDKYAYVDDIKGITNPNWTSYGKNLIKPLKITNDDIDVLGSYAYRLNATGTSYSHEPLTTMPVAEGQSVILQAKKSDINVGGRISLKAYDKDDNYLSNICTLYNSSFTSNDTKTTSSDTVPTNARYVRVLFTSDGTITSGTSTKLYDIQLELGSTATTFQEQNIDYLTLKDTFYANDSVSFADGKFSKLAKQKEVILDGTLAWEHYNDYTGYKTAGISGFPSDRKLENNSDVVDGVKHDGKILSFGGIADGSDIIGGGAWSGAGFNGLLITVSDTDTGFLDGQTPTGDEWSAYFNGWTYTNDINGDGTTGDIGWINKYDSADTTTDINVALSRNTHEENGKKGNFVVYELAQTVDEAVEHAGTVNPTLPQGKAQVGFDEGVIRREVANPYQHTDGNWYISWENYSSSNLDYRNEDILDVFVNNKIFNKWTKSSYQGFGKYRIVIDGNDYNGTDPIEVDYKALDYQLSTHVSTSDVEYDENIRSTVNRNIQNIADQGNEISILSDQKANKEQEDWIEPILLNGWSNVGGSNQPVMYRIDEFGLVHIKGLATGGTLDSPIFFLDEEAKPPKNIQVVTYSYDSAYTNLLSVVVILETGEVKPVGGSNFGFSMNIRPFQAKK